MTISDLISICGILVSLLISVITLLYNSKVIKDSLKPDVQAYINYLTTDTTNTYLIIKNFGKLGTTIKNIENNLPNKIDVVSKLLNYLDEVYLAPEQIICLPIDAKNLIEEYKITKIHFKFDYTFKRKNLKFDKYLSLDPIVNINTTYDSEAKALSMIYNTLNRLLSK